MNPTGYESLDVAVNQGDGKRLLNERAPPSRMQTMPGKSLATSLKRKRRAVNDMHFQTPFACASGL